MLSLGLYLFGYLKSSTIKQEIVSQLNQYLDVEISVQDIQFQILKSFPYATLSFHKVSTKGKDQEAREKLINAEEVSVLFDIVELIKGNYILKKIIIKNAFLNILVLPDGSANYKIITASGETNNSKFKIDLKNVEFSNVSISYMHYPSNQEYLFRINKGQLIGLFSMQNQQLDFKGDVFSTHIKSGTQVFMNDRNLEIDLKLELNSVNKSLAIHEGFIKTGGLQFSFAGNIQTEQNKPILDFTVQAEKTELSVLLNSIPKDFLKPIKDFKLNGKIQLKSQIKGTFSGNQVPRIKFKFDVFDGDFKYPQKNLHFKNIDFSGSFDNGKKHNKQTYSLALQDAEVALEGGKLFGNLNIKNFERPTVKVQFTSTVQLSSITNYFSLDKVKSMNGLLEINMNFKNTLKDFRQFTIHDFISSQTSGEMKISNMHVELANSPHEFTNFNGSFMFNNKDLEVSQFSGAVSGTDFLLKGTFQNVLAYIFDNKEAVYISADLKSKHFNLNSLLPKSDNKTSTEGLRFSNRINYKLNINLDAFSFRKFNATNITGTIQQENRILSVSDVKFNSMDGNAKIWGTINGRNPINHLIDCKANITNVNIQKLFHDMGNFGQQNITDEHIRGTVDATIEYSSTLSPKLKIDAGSVYSLANINITNGELINYQPLQKLSKYIKEEELKHVRFSKLSNQVKIENKVVNLPAMDIESSSLNIHLFGNHDFDNKIDYHLQLLVSEIFLKKNVTETETGNDFVKDDGLGQTKLFIRLTGNANNPVVTYDTREVRDKIASDLKQEKENIKQALQDEFKIQPSDKEEEQPLLIEEEGQKDFIIEWEKTKEDSVNKQSQEKAQKKVKKKKSNEKDFIIIWDEENDTIKLPYNGVLN